MTSLEQDITSFRNIIKVLQKYETIGDCHPNNFWSGESNHFREQLKCETINWNDDTPPEDLEDILENGDQEYGYCNIFFHLIEQEPKNGCPSFLSMKHWGGQCDYDYPEFIWIEKLQMWGSDSCGSDCFFRFLEPFEYTEEPDVALRSDLAEQTIEKLGSHLR